VPARFETPGSRPPAAGRIRRRVGNQDEPFANV